MVSPVKFAITGKPFLNSITFILYLIVAVSFAIHFQNRSQHYQEQDSFYPYLDLKFFPEEQYQYNSWSYYPSEKKVPVEQFYKLLTLPWVDRHVVVPIIQRFPFKDLKRAHRFKIAGVQDRARIIYETLVDMREKHWNFALRMGYLTLLEVVNPSYTLRAPFALALGSTYAPGVGLAYGLINNEKSTLSEFISTSTVITLLLFHITVVLIYITSLRLGFHRGSAVFSALVFLFSISHYSYGYHLGSTIWNIASASAWLWVMIKSFGNKSFLPKLSLATGVLIFFNYLLIFYWSSFLVAYYLFNTKTKGKDWLYQVWHLAKSQSFAVISMGICVVLFLQPGQGNRGNVHSFKQFQELSFYVVLNFFSFFNESTFGNRTQFALAMVMMVSAISMAIIRFWPGLQEIRKSWLVSMLLCLGFTILLNRNGALKAAFIPWITMAVTFAVIFFAASRKRGVQSPLLFYCFFAGVIFAFIGFAFIKETLGYVPSRHILFLSPVIFLILPFAIEPFFERAWFAKISPALFLALVILGFVGVNQRLQKTKDSTLRVSVTDKIDVLDVPIDATPFRNRYMDKPNAGGQRKKGLTYLYVSQEHPLQLTQPYEKIEELTYVSRVFFIAHNPLGLPHNRPNDLYMTKYHLK